jgi:lysophospholipase L1-like esterase
MRLASHRHRPRHAAVRRVVRWLGAALAIAGMWLGLTAVGSIGAHALVRTTIVTAPTTAAPATTAPTPTPATPTTTPSSTPSTAAPAVRAPHVVVLGDSVPAGDACSCTPYATLVGNGLAQLDGTAVTVTNAGVGGLTTAGLLAQLNDADLVQQLSTATVVTVTIGANDFDESLAAQSACAAGVTGPCYAAAASALPALLDQVLQRIDTLVPAGTSVLVTGYWNVFQDGAVGQAQGATYVSTADALTLAVNAIISQAAAANGDVYVDEYAPFHATTAAGLTALLAADGDHPSASGHELIADLLLTALSATQATPAHA